MAKYCTGLVVQHGAARNLVLPDGEDPADPQLLYSCVLRGRLRKGPRQRVRPVVIGDRVEFTRLEGRDRHGAIETVLPRHNFISRPQPSGGQHRKLEQVVVSNLDRLWVVVSLALPPLNRRFLDRILAAACHQGVQAGLVLNKVDLEQAVEQLTSLGFDKSENRAVVLAGENWHGGVVGIVASRIVDKFNCPTIILSIENGIAKGSGRSIPGFNILEAIQA